MTQLIRIYRFMLRHAGALTASGVVLLFALSPFALNRGLVHAEAYQIIPHYLSERPALAKIFDPNGADAGCYTARELSYVFDYLDCQVIAAGVRHGWPHFLSLTHYAFSILIMLAMWLFARCRLELSAVLAGALVLLFATTPAFFLGGGFFRSAKIGAAMCTIICVLLVARAVAEEFAMRDRLSRLPILLGVAVSSMLMGLFDRQGFALSMLAAFLITLRALWLRRHATIPLVVAMVAAPFAVVFYNHVIGPALIARINHYTPSFEFQQLPLGDLAHSPETAITVGLYAPVLMLDNLRFLIGGIPLAAAALLLVAGWWFLSPRWPLRDDRPIQPSSSMVSRLWFGLIPAALLVMNALMILRVKAMLNLDYRRIYYGLPSVVVFWLLTALAVKALSRWPGWRPRHALLIVTALVVCNLAGLLEQRAIIRRGLYLTQHETSRGIIQALKHLDRVPPAQAEPPYWPTGDTKRPETDGLVRFFRRLQLAEQGKLTPPP
jgi:hypothetical protein